VGQAIVASDESQKRKMDKKNQDSIITNIARQIVNKFGFQSWWLNVVKTVPKHAKKQFLFVGIDVFHAPPVLLKGGDKKTYWQKRSIAAYTAKLVIDRQPTLFYCSTEVRDAGAEIVGQRTRQSDRPSGDAAEPGSSHVREKISPTKFALGAFIQDALEHWKDPIVQKNLVVIVYRDGVAESQMDEVDAAEVAQVQSALSENVHMIYSVIQKRVHNRFVMSDGPKTGNCQAGTVVEDLALHGSRHNFFMVPCTTNLSTNKPVHYTICHDSRPGEISLSEFYYLTFAAHHTYQNWAGTVKVPDVCQYAHKLAYTLGECRIQCPVVPPDLQATMFYL
jgi:hypothetical protein